MTDLASIEVAGSVAVVTGGASGIGRGIVRALLEADAIVVVADVEQAVLDTTVATLSASHPGSAVGHWCRPGLLRSMRYQVLQY